MLNAPLRIVVTGSRDWEDSFAVHRAIDLAIDDLRRMAVWSGEVLVKPDIRIDEGGCETGADKFAREFREQHDYRGLTYKAAWRVPPMKGDPAGPQRNYRMLVEPVRARVVVAFPLGDRRRSPGTWNCIEQAACEGIAMRVFGRRP